MAWTSIIAIYVLFWVMSAFLVMPFGIKTHDEAGIPKIPGQAESAPANFQPKKVALRATILATLLCGIFVANYSYGWVTVEDIDIFGGLREAN
jgi:predicted secreted protein